MPKKHMTEGQVREHVYNDDKVNAALMDLILAVDAHGPDNVTGHHLIDIIAMRLESWSLFELDTDEDDCCAQMDLPYEASPV